MNKEYSFLFEDEYETKEGESLRFEFEERVKEDYRGLVVHELKAFLEETSEEVGYIKASYIPKKEWGERYNGDIGFIRWMAHLSAACGLTASISDSSPSEIGTPNIDKMNFALSKKFDSHRKWLVNNREKYQQLSLSEKEKLLEEYIKTAKKRCGEQYKKDYEFHVDKPLVDYIKVDREHRRKGIGFALYKKMAKELKRRFGLPFYASGVQTDKAKMVWEKLKEVLPVKKETYDWYDGKRTRYKIDYR